MENNTLYSVATNEHTELFDNLSEREGNVLTSRDKNESFIPKILTIEVWSNVEGF